MPFAQINGARLFNEPFVLAGHSVAPGGKAVIHLPVLPEPDGTAVVIPTLVVHGVESGPVLNLSAGQHGDEYMAGEACRRLYAELEPSGMRGTLVAAPCINLPAFQAGNRITPDDKGDLNRLWPGRPDGTLTERIAYSYLHEVITKCDYVLDFHDGGSWLAMEPLCGVDRVGHEALYRRARHLAEVTGLRLLWEDDPWPGTLPIAAFNLGKPALTVEFGADLDDMEATVAAHLTMMRSTMRGLGILPGQPTPAGAMEEVKGKFARSTARGLFKPLARRGAAVTEGDLLGVVIGATGEVMAQVRAVASGRLLFLRRVSVVQPGERVYLIGKAVV